MPQYNCDGCDATCDPTKDPHCLCTDPWGGNGITLCESCRESAYDRQQERLMEDGGGPSLLEQQQDAYRIKHGLRR